MIAQDVWCVGIMLLSILLHLDSSPFGRLPQLNRSNRSLDPTDLAASLLELLLVFGQPRATTSRLLPLSDYDFYAPEAEAKAMKEGCWTLIRSQPPCFERRR